MVISYCSNQIQTLVGACAHDNKHTRPYKQYTYNTGKLQSLNFMTNHQLTTKLHVFAKVGC
jgi:hypothetical protein